MCGGMQRPTHLAESLKWARRDILVPVCHAVIMGAKRGFDVPPLFFEGPEGPPESPPG
jgi:hypothetical protein